MLLAPGSRAASGVGDSLVAVDNYGNRTLAAMGPSAQIVTRGIRFSSEIVP